MIRNYFNKYSPRILKFFNFEIEQLESHEIFCFVCKRLEHLKLVDSLLKELSYRLNIFYLTQNFYSSPAQLPPHFKQGKN